MVCASLDQQRVVAAHERAVQGRADAGVGLRAGDDEPPDAALGEHRLELGVLEGVAVALVHERLVRRTAASSGTYCHASLPSASSSDACCTHTTGTLRGPRPVDQRADVRHDGVAVVRAGHDAVLHVDDQQGGVRAVGKRGHGTPRQDGVIVAPSVANGSDTGPGKAVDSADGLGPMLLLARALTPDLRASVVELERRTVAHDGGRLKLEWGSLDALTEQTAGPPRLALWTEADRVVGFVGRYAFGGSDTAELAGMVDPAHRRRGIGTNLLRAALDHTHDFGQVLLVVPRTAGTGDAFARAQGGRLNHSEHALVLRGDPRAARRIEAVSLRRAEQGDRRAVGDLIESGFGMRHDDLDERTFVVLHGDQLVGTLALSLRDGRGGVFGFVVDEQWRGRGIGRDVLARACTLLRDEGADEIGLEVLTDNEHALGLYTSVGFEPFVTEDYYELDAAARVPSPA